MKWAPGCQFLFLVGISLAFGWRVLSQVFGLAAGNEAYTHILLILPLSAGMIFLVLLRQRPVLQTALVPGSLLLAASLAGAVASFAMGWPADLRLAVAMFAMVTWWLGSAVLCFGIRAAKSILFPLCFLYWLIPIPDGGLQQIIHLLQHASAFATRVLFIVSGMPVTQDGTLLSLPAFDIEVAPECSSIRSSMVLVITTMFLAHLFLRSRWRKGLVIAAAIPLAAAKNGLRIFTIAQLGMRDPSYFDGNLHHRGGVVFFGIAVLVTISLVWLLRKTESGAPHSLQAL